MGFAAVSFHMPRAEYLFSLLLFLPRSPLTRLWISSHLPSAPPCSPKTLQTCRCRGEGAPCKTSGREPTSSAAERVPTAGLQDFWLLPAQGHCPVTIPPAPSSSLCPCHTGGDKAQRGDGCSAPCSCPLPCPQATEMHPPPPPPSPCVPPHTLAAQPSQEFLLLLPLSRSDVSSWGCRHLIIPPCRCGWLPHPRAASAQGSEREALPRARPGGRTRWRCTCSRGRGWARAGREMASPCLALAGREGWIWGVSFGSGPQHPLEQGDLGLCVLPGEAHPDLSTLLGS